MVLGEHWRLSSAEDIAKCCNRTSISKYSNRQTLVMYG